MTAQLFAANLLGALLAAAIVAAAAVVVDMHHDRGRHEQRDDRPEPPGIA